MDIVFLGRKTHLRTKSDLFFIELLKEIGNVTIFRSEEFRSRELVKKINLLKPNMVIFFQLPPSVSKHLYFIRCKNFYWVPMWDGYNQPNFRKQLAYRFFEVKVISFCRKVYELALSMKLKTIFVQYFPKPILFAKKVLKEKPPYKVFFWQRISSLGIHEVIRVFGRKNIEKIIYKSDPGINPNLMKFSKLEKLDEWLSDSLYEEKVRESDFYFAPRFKEGIGFSYLKAMAVGTPVIAYDAATMNEYIKNGLNGLLYDDHFIFNTDLKSPSILQKGLSDTCLVHYQNWLNSKEQIKQFLSQDES